MHSKKLARIVALILAVILVLTFIISAVSYVALAAPSEDEIAGLVSEGEELAQKIVEVESQINSFEFDNLTILGKKEMLDKLVILTEAEIECLYGQIYAYDALAVELQDELITAQSYEKQQLAGVTNRVRAFEENGVLAYFSIVFEAESFADFLGRVDFMVKLLQYDEQLYASYSAAKTETAVIQSKIDGIESEKDKVRLIIEEKETDLEARVDDSEQFIYEVESSRETYEQLCLEIDEGQKNFENVIENKTARQIRINQRIKPGTGAFVWPLMASNTVIQTFGTKLNSEYNIYRVHNGVDISGEYGSNVIASDSGTVTAADYDPIYGNYIVINHGNGYETIYAQLSVITVEEGDEVTQGDVIGCLGSTGYSARAHLHFEIRFERNCINPLQYFNGYTLEQ